MSFGINLRLPFEQRVNPFIGGDPKLIALKYFFTRKLMFIKEADAFVLFPGGFGTMDELFELLTLEQTGKSDLHPIVMMQAAGTGYWEDFERHMRDNIILRGYAEEPDAGLYHITEDPVDAVRHIQEFYRVYHSQRWVGDKLVLRLAVAPDDSVTKALSEEFSDILREPVRAISATPAEVRDDDVCRSGDPGEIEPLVPGAELVEIALEPRDLRRVERDAPIGRAALELPPERRRITPRTAHRHG